MRKFPWPPSFILILIFTAVSFAQTADYYEIQPLKSISVDPLWCIKGNQVDGPLPTHEKCTGIADSLGYDPLTQTFVLWEASSDRNMRVKLRIFRSDSEKRIRVVINNIYGGSKAWGQKGGALTLERPPKGYTVSIEEVRVDRIHDGEDRDVEFKLPDDLKEKIPVRNGQMTPQ
ncbi:MAG: hypothetical protein KF881_08940 [Acidobacteria bacterium]|nr:hypothetical protein [Acidobacteriota bacterium]